MSEPVTACILVIGNEILSGRTKDVNLGFLAEELTKLGIQVREARFIPDIEETIIDSVNFARHTFDYVFTTGGIGPTHDDITSACIAKAFNRDLIQNPEAVAILEKYYAEENRELNTARLRMAATPTDVTLIENPVSRAPGYQVENVFVLAGVPRICRAMFDNLKDRLTGGAPVLSITVSTHLGEGTIAEELGHIQESFKDIDIGSYPFFKDEKHGVSLVMRSTDEKRNQQCAQTVKEMIESLGGQIIFSS